MFGIVSAGERKCNMVKTTCEKCKKKECSETGKPCKKIEEALRKEKIYSRDYIRPHLPYRLRKKFGKWREIPLSSLHYNEDTGEYYDKRKKDIPCEESEP